MGQYLKKLLKNSIQKLPKNKVRKFIFLAWAIFFLLTYFGGDYGFVRIYRLHQKEAQLQIYYKQLQADILQLQQEKKLLEDDPFIIEKLARERFGLSRPDEKVFRFLPPVDSTKFTP
jgi:cell division protein FtsB